MPTDARTRPSAPPAVAIHHVLIGRYRDATGEHTVALTRDPDAGGPWRLTDSTEVTMFFPEETAADASATARLYLRERGGS